MFYEFYNVHGRKRIGSVKLLLTLIKNRMKAEEVMTSNPIYHE